jgi:hypothetical protein
MKKLVLIGILIFAFLVLGFLVEGSPQIDSSKANKAEAVLRVKFVSLNGGSKYDWDEVEVLKVLKNKSGYTFGKTLSVAHYSWNPGIPEGTCTIYLQRYNPERNDLWKLLDGSAEDGVGHKSP